MAGMKAAVFGANGFVGRALTSFLRGKGYNVREIVRGDATWRDADLGHVFYCIGLTADFRSRPFETIEAHCGVVKEVLAGAEFSSFVYLSSTRVYARASSTDETAAIPVLPADPDDLYNISKLMGEAACLGSGLSNARVARLSNVFGADLESQNFLTSVLSDATQRKAVHLRTSLQSEKDYVWIGDVVRALEAIAREGTEPITNVAYGRNTTHCEILEAVAAATGATVSVAPEAPTVRFLEIATQRLDGLIGKERTALSGRIGELAAAFGRR
jgi:nucleoside-diphosphate-sugar epimerase